MGKIIGSARLAHHTVTGIGSTFSVPVSEDFTDGSWTIKDLALSEIGVNEGDKKAYIRIDGEIKEFQFTGATPSADDLETTLVAGNTTGGNDIIVDLDDLIKGGGSASISLGTTARPNQLAISSTDNISNDVSQVFGPGITQMTGVLSGDDTASFSLTNDGVVSISAYDTTLNISDIILVDPNNIQGGTGIISQDYTTGNVSQTTYTPDKILSSVNDAVLGDNTYTILETQNILIGALNGADEGYTNYTKDTIISKVYNDTPGITDTISIDPKLLGNGTGIKSLNTTSGDYSNLVVTPTLIRLFQDDVTNGQNRRITIEPSYISLVADASSIIIDEGSQIISLSTEPYNILGASTNKISIGSSNVRNVISTETTTTTNATITTIHRFTCVGNGPKSYKVRVVGYKTDFSKAYLGELFGLYNYDGVTVTLIGSLDLVEKTNFTTATSTITISGSTIRVRVTGEALTDINWSVYVEMNDIQ